MMHRVQRNCAVALAVSVAALATGTSWAQSAKPVEMRILAIRATTKDNKIDPELKSIAAKLKKQFKYTGFRVIAKKNGKATVGASFSTALTGGYKVKITPKSRTGKRVRLTIEVTKREGNKDKRKLNTTVEFDAGKFQLQGGWKLSGGDVLIMAVSAR
jgi:hypothetical protein